MHAEAHVRSEDRALSLFGLAPGGACHAPFLAVGAVCSYHAVSPLPDKSPAVCSLLRFPWGYPRRALPGTLPLWSPDFPRQRRFQLAVAAAQPPDQGLCRENDGFGQERDAHAKIKSRV